MAQRISLKENSSLIIILLYAAFFFAINVIKYYSFSFYDFDLALHAQTMWNIIHGSIQSSVHGIPFIGNHAHLILFLIAPLYKLSPHPVTLLFLQVLSLAAAGFVICSLAAQVLGKKWEVVTALAYISYPALGYLSLYEFHPSAFAVLFFSLAFLGFYKNNFLAFMLWGVMAMLCQENIPLVVASFGIYAAFSKKSLKWIIWPLALGIAWFWMDVFILKPRLGGATIEFDKLYSHLGGSIPSVFINMALHPIKILRLLLVKENLNLFIDLFGPLGFVSLISPLPLIMASPSLLQHMLSSRATEHTIYYHYMAEIIPFIFISAIFGLKALRRFKAPDWLLIFVILTASIGFNIYSAPHIRLIQNLKPILKDSLDNYRSKLIKKIPKGAEVVATFQFLTPLSNRAGLYSFHHVSSGFYTLSTTPYKLPETTEYAILDFDDPLFLRAFYLGDSDIKIMAFFKNSSWEIIDVVNSIIFMKKKSGPNSNSLSALYEKLDKEPENHTVPLSMAVDEILFLGGDNGELQEGQLIPLALFWKCKSPTKKRYGISVDLVDEKANIIHRTHLPHCYRIYPTYRWKENEIIKENYNLFIPSDIPKEKYNIVVSSFDEKTGTIYSRTTIGKIILK